MIRWLVLGLLSVWVSAAATASELNYYEWSGVAPIVTAATSLGENGRFHEFGVRRVFRGSIAPEQVLRVELKLANRERRREVHPHALHLDLGRTYLLLLDMSETRKGREADAFRLIRGVDGIRSVPAEGDESLYATFAELIEIQNLKNDLLTWERFEDLLEDTDPLLLVTALEQFQKFRRGDADLLPAVRPLLSHPSAGIREQASRLSGQILERHSAGAVPGEQALWAELISRARRDPAVAVRVAATEALHAFNDDNVRQILEQIAAEDPDQAVRYVAEKAMLERRRRESVEALE